jgi:predicted Zn-dependent protease with MMP-like domain
MAVMNVQEFKRLVAEALDSLPDVFRQRLDNVAIVVEEWPDPQALRQAGVTHPAQLLGLYHGVPLSRRTHNYGLVPPDKISIYRQPILMRCRTREEIRATIHRVLRHEIAHHFGIDDERLREIGAY